jgi:hypothetical protein
MGELRNEYSILFGKQRKRHLRRPRHRWEENIRIILREIGGKLWTGCISGCRPTVCSCRHGSEPSGSINDKEFD